MMATKPVSLDEIKFLAADPEDLKTILELQYLAYQSEAKLLNTTSIPPLQETLNVLEVEFR